MKKYFSFLFLLSVVFGFAQFSVIHYKYIKHLPGREVYMRDRFLLFNTTESYYLKPSLKEFSTYSDLRKAKDAAIKQERDMGSIFTHNSNTIFYGDAYAGMKNYIYRDEYKPINWKIQNQYKKIMGYRCQKAEGVFRGRTYVVWFATDIPYPVGPWKLGGLPGLILEAQDSEQIFSFKAVGINLNAQERLPQMLQGFYKVNSAAAISYKAFIQKREKALLQIWKKIIARAPKGARARSEPNLRSGELEKSFEWELPEKQNAIDISSLKK